MAQTVTNFDGSFVYRTKPMASAQAISFHRMLCNNRNFEAVSLSELTKSGKQSVYFRPVGRTAQVNLYTAEQDKRTIAAAEGEFIFWNNPDCTSSWWCYSCTSGETYEVSCMSCTCPDYVYRCDKAGIQCKHQQAWEMQARAGILSQNDKKTPLVTPSGAVCDVDLDFP